MTDDDRIDPADLRRFADAGARLTLRPEQARALADALDERDRLRQLVDRREGSHPAHFVQGLRGPP